MLRSVCTTAAGVALLLAGGGSAWAAGAPAAVPRDTCTGVIQISGFMFHSPGVSPGSSAPAPLSATNCTAQSQTVTEEWTSSYSSASEPGVPDGCPAPVSQDQTQVFAALARLTSSTTYTIPVGCAADLLTVTVQLSQGGTALGSATATLRIIRPLVTT